MCLIVKCDTNIPLSRDVLKDMHERNQDGFGFMYHRKGKIHVKKSHETDLEAFIQTYEETKEYNPVFHLRMRTHGDIDTENTHPYECAKGVWLMHNGVMHWTTLNGKDATKSDTWHFINDYINPLLEEAKDPKTFIRSQAFRLLAGRATDGQKIILGDDKGYVVLNPSSWFQVTNELTGLKNLIVSNFYAWKGNEYRTPEFIAARQAQWAKEEAERKAKQQASTPVANRENFMKGEDDESDSSLSTGPSPTAPVKWFGGRAYEHIKKNLYGDSQGLVWKWNGRGFIRKGKFDKTWRAIRHNRATQAQANVVKQLTQAAALMARIPSPSTQVPATSNLPIPSKPHQISLLDSLKDNKAPGEVTILTPEQYQLIQNKPVLVVNNPGEDEESLVVVGGHTPAPNYIPSTKEYNEILVRDWKNSPRYSIEGRMLAESEDATRILNYLLDHHHA